MRRRSRSNRHSSSRHAAVLVVAMVCLVIASLILGVLAHVGTLHYRQQRSEQERAQAEWLAESGIERAADRIASDANYSGEEWLIPSAELGGVLDGKVRISVAAEADNRLITVAATYPTNTSPFATVSKQVTLRVKSQP